MEERIVSKNAAVVLEKLHVQRQSRVLIEGLSLALSPSESVAIVGPSGCGKTSLISIIAGFDDPTMGTVDIFGTRLSTLTARRRSKFRAQNMGLIAQRPEVIEELDAFDNLYLAALLHGREARDSELMARDVVARMELDAATALARDLSGGERTRVAIGRALTGAPRLLLADEPTASLDPVARNSVCDLLFALPAAGDLALMVVTHDEAVAERATYRIDLGDYRP